MYCVVKITTNVGSVTEATGVPKIKTYHCNTKKLASDYVRKWYESKSKTLPNKKNPNVKFINSGIKGDSSWANVEYVNKNLLSDPYYMYTREEMHVIYSKEILDLPNGPALRV